jgi:hypothetical protein
LERLFERDCRGMYTRDVVRGLLTVFVWFAALAACSQPAAHDFTLQVDVGGIDPAVTSVSFGGMSYPVQAGRVSVTAEFTSADAAAAAGPLAVDFIGAGSAQSVGHVEAGACTTCVYAGCPTQQSITLEIQEYNSAAVEPGGYLCFSCIDPAHDEKACE